MRLGLVGMLIVTVALSQHYRSRPVVMASALVVASLGLVGHAAMDLGRRGPGRASSITPSI